MLILSQSVYVSLAYRYWNNQWSHEENQRRYGALASKEGLGGNWRIEIGREVEPGQEVPAEEDLKAQLARLKGMVDHRALFNDLPAFQNTPSTLENVASHLASDLFKQGPQWKALTIFENEHVWCRCRRGKSELEFTLRIMNLTLTIRGLRNEAGLMTSREQVTQAVIGLLPQFADRAADDEQTWAEQLFGAVAKVVPGLSSLRVDPGSGQYIVVE